MTEPDEKPKLFLPKTTALFTGVSVVLLLVALGILVAAAVLLVEVHWLFPAGPAD